MSVGKRPNRDTATVSSCICRGVNHNRTEGFYDLVLVEQIDTED